MADEEKKPTRKRKRKVTRKPKVSPEEMREVIQSAIESLKDEPAVEPVINAEATETAEPVQLPEIPRIKRRFDPNNFRLIAAVCAILIGGFIGKVWMSNYQDNAMLGLVAFVCFFGAFILGRMWWNRRGSTGETIVLASGTAKVEVKQVNSLNIYPDKILFENVEKPEGQPWKCKNDGKLYYIHTWNEKEGKLEAFKLPDQQYMTPEYFAERVLALPAHRRIFRRKQSMLEQLSPMMALGACIAFGIIMLVTLG